MSQSTETRRTSKGIEIEPVHPMARTGSKYRFTNVSGAEHVDEYVGSCGAWVYLGYIVPA